jgi:predicted SprT family Zn-dependent metalloprotease
MNLQTAENLCNELMKLHGITEKGYYFKWLNSKKMAGQCHYTYRQIGLSKHLTILADEADVKDTILHEIAHALCPNHGHDRVWSRVARSIGANGLRCYGMNGQKDSLVKARQTLAKYIGTCPNGHNTFKSRLPKRKHSCGKCSNTFNEKYLIVYATNKPI